MGSKPQFENLFQPGRIGEMALRNRIVMAPTANNYGTRDGYVTQRTKDYYEARAQGGVPVLDTTIPGGHGDGPAVSNQHHQFLHPGYRGVKKVKLSMI